MDYNIKKKYIDDIDNNEKVIISSKNYYCTNCNRKGHSYKKCVEPIISNGIIGIHIDNFNREFLPLLNDYIKNNFHKKIKILPKNLYSDKIKFMLIQRKHSLGYLEFMRGRYNVNNIKEIKYILEQTTPEELDDIINKDFDYLWNTLWGNHNVKNKNHYKEYITSKQKFYELKIKNDNLFKSTKCLYNFNEWGFPKGRRELYENDIVCAMREFEEETNYKENDYIIIDDKYIIKENLIGTNGLNYRHNYYLALLTSNKESNESNKENKEIADIKLMNINDCLEVIRPYHQNKMFIIKKIHNLISNFLLEYSSILNSFLTH